MNIFRLLGDLAHLLAIIILLLKIWKTRSCAGKSDRLDRFAQGRACIHDELDVLHPNTGDVSLD